MDDAALDARIRGMRIRGVPHAEIAAAVGLSTTELRDRVTRIWAHANERSSAWVDPTPEEIAERAAIERLQWTERDYRMRSSGLPPDWTPPLVSVRGSLDW